MAKASKAFGQQSRSKLFESIPKAPPPKSKEPDASWQASHPSAMPGMMFELRFADGQILCYPFHHLHTIRYRDAGYLELSILGREVITIIGRHLRELVGLLRSGRIQWIEEIGARDEERAHEQPTVVKITIEAAPAK
jgi:hypothetical protein